MLAGFWLRPDLELEEAGGPEVIGRGRRATIEIMSATLPGITPLDDLTGYNQDRTPGSRLTIRLPRAISWACCCPATT